MNKVAHTALRKDYLVFSLAGKEYGVVLETVQELCNVDLVQPLPGAPAHIAGIVTRSGRPIAVVALHALLSPGQRDDGRVSDIVILQAGDRRSGITVDCVIDVVMLGDGDIRPCDAGESGIIGMARQGRREILLLDAEYLLTNYEPVSNERLAA